MFFWCFWNLNDLCVSFRWWRTLQSLTKDAQGYMKWLGFYMEHVDLTKNLNLSWASGTWIFFILAPRQNSTHPNLIQGSLMHNLLELHNIQHSALEDLQIDAPRCEMGEKFGGKNVEEKNRMSGCCLKRNVQWNELSSFFVFLRGRLVFFYFKVEKVGSSVSKNTTKTSGRRLTEYFDAINLGNLL